MAGYLVDGNTQAIIQSISMLNPQMSYGADVITPHITSINRTFTRHASTNLYEQSMKSSRSFFLASFLIA
jgi:hypothetical protein